MNIMFLLIPALLLAMEVASMAAVTVTPPQTSGPRASAETGDSELELDLRVSIRSDGFVVQSGSRRDRGTGGEDQARDLPTLPLLGPSPSSNSNYDYDGLEAKAAVLIDRHPEETRVRISAEADVPMQVLVSTMDALRGSDCRMAEIATGSRRPERCLFYESVVESGWVF